MIKECILCIDYYLKIIYLSDGRVIDLSSYLNRIIREIGIIVHEIDVREYVIISYSDFKVVGVFDRINNKPIYNDNIISRSDYIISNNYPFYKLDNAVSLKRNLFYKIIDWDNMLKAYKSTQKGKLKLKYSAMKFKEYYPVYLKQLRDSIISNEYKHRGYIKFVVYEPKMRIIYAPNYKDKIVQHMINNILRDVYEPLFIFDSYACIRNKGNQAAVLRIQKFQRQASMMYKSPYFLKLDISKFFYTIDRDILKKILIKKIHDEMTLKLLFLIIDSFDEPKGLPLGNLTSQLFANIYLNEIDHIIKRKYRVRFYVRYADDMFLIVKDKETALYLKEVLVKEIKEILDLTVNPKKAYVSPYNVIDGLGFKISPNNIKVLSKNKRRLKHLILKGDTNSLSSWYGYSHISNCQSLITKSLRGSKIVFTNNKFKYIKDLK